MKKTKTQVRDALGLDELPDDEFMDLLASTGEGPLVEGPVVSADHSYTSNQLVAELTGAYVATQLGELLSRARADAGLSLREAGAVAGVSRGRIHQLVASENMEVATLVRVADALGYDVKITLVPERGDLPPLNADLSGLVRQA